MQRYKIVLQQEQRFNLVLPYHDKYSIDIEGLISVLYVDGVPVGMILDCNQALVHGTIFASAETESWALDASNDVSATVVRYAWGEAGMTMEAASALAFNTIFASSGDLNQLYLKDSVPDADLFLNFYAPSCKLVLHSELAADALLVFHNMSEQFKTTLKTSVSEMYNHIFASADRIPMSFSDRGYLGIGADVAGVQTSMLMDATAAVAHLFTPYYVSEWTEYNMSELADMTMFDMMYGEVLE